MTLSEFKRLAAKNEVNTNNGWGFGGKAGTSYTLVSDSDKTYTYYDLKYYYRHSNPSSAKSYYIDDESVSANEFTQAIEVEFNK